MKINILKQCGYMILKNIDVLNKVGQLMLTEDESRVQPAKLWP